jgi:MFS family permease
MLKKVIHKIAAHRHPWREMKFDELAEVYTSMTMRSIGFGMIGIFVPVYLYDLGVSIQSIVFFFLLLFIFRIPISFIVAFVVARIGPKHSIGLSTVVSVLFLSLLLSYESMQWPLLILSLVYTTSLALFFIGINVDFSKIQHKKHGGKELGWLYVLEKFGMAAGPFIGGVLASLFFPELTLVTSILVLLLSLVKKQPTRSLSFNL